MPRNDICQNHPVFVRDLYEGKAHPEVLTGLLHTVEIGPNDLPLNQNGLLLGYFDDHLILIVLMKFFLAVDKYPGDGNVPGLALYGALVCNNCNGPSYRDSGVSALIDTIHQFSVSSMLLWACQALSFIPSVSDSARGFSI